MKLSDIPVGQCFTTPKRDGVWHVDGPAGPHPTAKTSHVPCSCLQSPSLWWDAEGEVDLVDGPALLQRVWDQLLSCAKSKSGCGPCIRGGMILMVRTAGWYFNDYQDFDPQGDLLIDLRDGDGNTLYYARMSCQEILKADAAKPTE
jgi:hypothetical protein